MSTVARAFSLAALLLACQTPIQGHFEVDQSAPFDTYTTYAWISKEPLVRPQPGVSGAEIRISPLVDQRIRAAVERNLQAKGFERSERVQSAHLALSFSVGARQEIRVDSYPSRAGYRYGPYAHGGWASDVRTSTKGTLAIDVFDVRSKQAVWHGWAESRISASMSQEARTELVNRAVDSILKSFPFRNTTR